MGDKKHFSVQLPPRYEEEIVKPMQRRIFDAYGEVLSSGLVVRIMLEVASTVDISQFDSHLVDSASN